MKKGIFITFEGIEGCGKSTQAKRLYEYLQKHNYPVLLTREPGGPAISEQIRDILLKVENVSMLPETEMLLYMASRSQHTGEWILPALEEGKIVISDRYYDSTIAYQGAARDIDLQIINIIRKYATYGLEPDLTVLLDIPVEISQERIKEKKLDRIELESESFHRKVRDGFLRIANEEKHRYYIIDGKLGFEEIEELIVKKIKEMLKDGVYEN